jgi:hypothetical protein
VMRTISMSLRLVLAVSLVLLPALARAAERRASKKTTPSPAARSVEMFDGINSNEIEVKLIPKDETEARVVIKNNTDEPLNVKLPDAFAGVPVLAQIGRAGGAGGIGGVGGIGGAGGQQQTMGGGMGGMGMMNVAPEKVAQFKVATVCLEHGKKPPRSSVAYEIKPIESFTSSGEIKSLLTAFGKGRLNQKATQAAAWHLANGMSWDELASKTVEEFGDPQPRPWFTPEELRTGMQITRYAVEQAQADEIKRSREKSPGEKSPGERSASESSVSTSKSAPRQPSSEAVVEGE